MINPILDESFMNELFNGVPKILHIYGVKYKHQLVLLEEFRIKFRLGVKQELIRKMAELRIKHPQFKEFKVMVFVIGMRYG